MQELVENKWFFWIVTGVIAAMWAALLYFIRRQRDAENKARAEERKLAAVQAAQPVPVPAEEASAPAKK